MIADEMAINNYILMGGHNLHEGPSNNATGGSSQASNQPDDLNKYSS
jgi:hypothetical protein